MKAIRTPRRLLALLLAAAPALLCGTVARAAEPYTLPVIVALTGGDAFIGNSVKANLEALQDEVNHTGGIDGRPLSFTFSDDESTPQMDVQIASRLIPAKPPVIIGGAGVALCNAMAPLMSSGPVLYCLSPAFNPLPNGYSFAPAPTTFDELAAIIRYMRLNGWTRIGVLNTTDATGQNADRFYARVMALPENKTVKTVSYQHFNNTDISVTAQLERIKGAGAQGLIAWTTGTAIANVFKGMEQTGFDVPVGTSAGNQTYQQMKQYADFLPQHLLIGSALFPEHRGIVTLDPRVEKAQQEMYAVLAAHHLKPDIATSNVWDSAQIVVAGLRQLGPAATAAQLRQYILNLTAFPGINGIYDYKTDPARGLAPGSATVVTYDAKNQSWQWLSEPGGKPLP